KTYEQVPLAYGATYQTAITSIDNSGVVDDPNFRKAGKGHEAMLKGPKSIAYNETTNFQYLCNEAIGAPEVVIESGSSMKPDEFYALSNQTKAATFAKQVIAGEQLASARLLANDRETIDQLTTNPRVALMAHEGDVSKAPFIRPFKEETPTQYTIELKPPVASPVMVERWLNAEHELAKNSETRKWIADRNIQAFMDKPGRKSDAVGRLRDSVLAEYKKLEGGKVSMSDFTVRYNPAVSAYGVRVTWRGLGASRSDVEVIPFDRVKAAGEELTIVDRKDARATVAVTTVTSRHDGKIRMTKERGAEIAMNPGEFVQIEIFSLADKKLFQGSEGESLARLSTPVADIGVPVGIENGIEYLGFGGASYWIEAAPRAQVAVDGLNDELLRVDVPTVANQPARLLVDAGAEGDNRQLSAEWIEALEVER
ncbi:MAG: hypothetical protein MO852_16475, partial [Candidatus Devosia euplotis]|nr:hypothetical protein [Candidatus Devosia euplotis]